MAILIVALIDNEVTVKEFHCGWRTRCIKAEDQKINNISQLC